MDIQRAVLKFDVTNHNRRRYLESQTSFPDELPVYLQPYAPDLEIPIGWARTSKRTEADGSVDLIADIRLADTPRGKIVADLLGAGACLNFTTAGFGELSSDGVTLTAVELTSISAHLDASAWAGILPEHYRDPEKS